MSAGAPLVDGAGHGEAPIVFVSDPTAEAERVARALRSGGYTVVDVPLSMLVARVAVQHPRVVLVDADSHGALDTVARMRELPQADDVHVVFITAPGGAISSLEEALAHEGSGLSMRPLDVDALVRQIDALSGGVLAQLAGAAPPGEARRASDRTGASASELAAGDAAFAVFGGESAAYGSAPPGSGRALALGPPESVSFSEPPVPASRIPVPKALSLAPPLSAELQRLLADAERRVHVPAEREALPSPEQEIEAVLPADLLAALDEPLEDEDEAEPAPQRHVASSASPSRDRTTDGGVTRTTGASTGGGSTPATPGPGRRVTEDLDLEAPEREATPAPSAPLASSSAPSAALAPSVRPPANVAAGAAVASEGAMTVAPPAPAAEEPPPAPPAARSASPSPPPPSPAPASRSSNRAFAARLDLTGEASRVVGRAIAARTSGSLCVAAPGGERRIVLREGDVVTCASTLEDESLIAFLGVRGDLPRETVRRLSARFPPFGRHAGAALVARGYLLQDQMWHTLRAHTEWILGRVLQAREPTGAMASLESQPPGRLASEPSVFGGAPGAEVFVEVVRRVVSPAEALERLGGPLARVGPGAAAALLDECSLGPAELDAIRGAAGRAVAEVLAALEGSSDAELASAVFALAQLGCIDVLSAAGDAGAGAPASDDASAIDAEAIRERVRARLQLVEDGDYFAVLGVPRDATGYEVKRAFLELRRSFEPSRLLSPDVADLVDDVRKIASVLDEAYEVLKDGPRRERYRRAIEGIAPG